MMVRLATVLGVMCSACVFDPGGSVGDDLDGLDGPNAELTDSQDPADQPPEPDPVDPNAIACTGELLLEASKDYDPSAFFPDDVLLDSSFSFPLPRDIEVIAGASGDHCAYLDIYYGADDRIRCGYKGSSGQSGGDFDGDGDGGGGGGGSWNNDYDFVQCRRGPEVQFSFCGPQDLGDDMSLQQNDTITADRLVLTVANGDKDEGTTVVEVLLQGTCQ